MLCFALPTSSPTSLIIHRFIPWESNQRLLSCKGQNNYVLQPQEVVADLSKSALEDTEDYVRKFAMDALKALKSEHAVPTFIRGLKDNHPDIRNYACEGLYKLGKNAKAAVPALIEGINKDQLGGKALMALVAIQGKDAIPIILRTVERGNLERNGIDSAVYALADVPDERSIPFMEQQLFHGGGSVPVHAAVFFSELGDVSIEQMRKCLDYDVPENDADDVREIAVKYLGNYKDQHSFDKILDMLSSDPSINVRTEAAIALGKFGRPVAASALITRLSEKDKGYSAKGHMDGALHEAVINSLGEIGTDEALAGIYKGLASNNTLNYCKRFWHNSKNLDHLDKFIDLFDKEPVEIATAAGIIETMLETHQTELKLKDIKRESAKTEFLAHVKDEKHFGEHVDLTEGGRYSVQKEFSLYQNNFATVSFTFKNSGHSYSVLYRKVGADWIPME